MSLPLPVLARKVALPLSVGGDWWRVVGDLHADARAGGFAVRAGLAAEVLNARHAGYRWGGVHWGPVPAVGSDVLDCSGFVSCILARLGVARARCTSTSVSSSWPVVPPGEVAPGDVAWWSGHVGLVVEPGRWYLDSGGEGRESVPTASGGGVVRARKWAAREGGPRAVHRPPMVDTDLPALAAWLAGGQPPALGLGFVRLPT